MEAKEIVLLGGPKMVQTVETPRQQRARRNSRWMHWAHRATCSVVALVGIGLCMRGGAGSMFLGTALISIAGYLTLASGFMGTPSECKRCNQWSMDALCATCDL
jgi:hypothetical protein